MIGRVLRAFGVEPGTFGVLRRAFTTLARRESSGLLQTAAGRGSHSMKAAAVLYAFYGLGGGLVAAFMPTRLLFATTYLTLALLLLALAVVVDFAAVVIVPGDDEILFHLPLSSRTYLAARLAVAARHTSWLALSFGAIPAVAAAVRWENVLCVPVYLLVTVWTGWFALILAFLFYRVALRVLGGERLRTWLAFLPGILTIAFMFGPGLVLPGRHGGSITPDAFDQVALFLPPVWFASMAEVALLNLDEANLVRAALGFAVVPLSAWVLLVALGRGFLQDLQRLVAGRDVGRERAARRRAAAPGRFARSPEARAGWLLYAAAMRSRASLTRAFPSLGIPVAAALLVALDAGSGRAGWVAFLPFMVAAAPAALMMLLPFHEDHAACWCLQTAPLRAYGRFWLGLVGAMLVRHVLPCALVVTGLLLVAYPPLPVLGGLLVTSAGAFLVVGLAGSLTARRLPFAQPFATGQGVEGLGVTLLALLVLGVLGGLHAALFAYLPWAVYVTIPVANVLGLLWIRAVARGLDADPPAELLSLT